MFVLLVCTCVLFYLHYSSVLMFYVWCIYYAYIYILDSVHTRLD